MATKIKSKAKKPTKKVVTKKKTKATAKPFAFKPTKIKGEKVWKVRRVNVV